MFKSNRQSRPSASRRPTLAFEPMDARRYCDGDNSLSTAANLGTVTAYTAKTGSLTSNSDTKDFYKFTVPAGSKNFAVKVGSLSKNADLYLYNSSKSQIAKSTSSGNTSEVVGKTLSPGTYYAEVRAKTGSSATTSYSLKLMSDSAGNDKAAARDIGAVTNGAAAKVFNEYAGSLDFNDYYKFTTTGGRVSATVTGLSGDADLQLLRPDGSYVTYSSASGTANESLTYDVDAGTYYLRVYPYTSSVDTKYTLSVSSTALDTGGTTATAAFVATPYTHTETIGNGDGQDLFKFDLADYSYAIMDLTVTSGPVTLTYYDQNGNFIGNDTAAPGDPAHLSYFAHTGGARYVGVSKTGTQATYTISIKTQTF